MLNMGPTRADTSTPTIEKIEFPTGVVLRDVVRALRYATLISLLQPGDAYDLSVEPKRLKIPYLPDYFRAG